MSFVMAFFYDRAIKKTEDACLRQWRSELLLGLEGAVLEIGAGTGASLPHYPPGVTRLLLSEPDPHMRRRLRARVEERNDARIGVVASGAEQIDAADASFDHVVASLVCCSVSDPGASLAEIHRVLRPGGSFVFLEHVAAAEGTSRRRWQDRLTPLWKRVMGNCHLNRDTERAIREAGFAIERIERESMRKAPPIVRPTIRGVARKSA